MHGILGSSIIYFFIDQFLYCVKSNIKVKNHISCLFMRDMMMIHEVKWQKYVIIFHLYLYENMCDFYIRDIFFKVNDFLFICTQLHFITHISTTTLIATVVLQWATTLINYMYLTRYRRVLLLPWLYPLGKGAIKHVVILHNLK